MFKILIPLIVLFGQVSATAQPVLDKDFQLITTNTCPTYDSSQTIFVKVEVDPVVLSITRSDFISELNIAINTICKEECSTGYIKMKILFPVNTIPCLRTIGFNGLVATTNYHDLALKLSQQFPAIRNHSPGLQRGQAQICEGVILLTVQNEQVEEIRTANFKFLDN